MKKIVLWTVLSVFCVSLSVSGQSRRQRRPAQVEYPSADLIQQVQLTDEQVAQLKANEESYRTSLKELADKSVKRDSIQSLMQTARKERLAGIKKVLSADQYVTYLEYELIHPRMAAPFAPRREAPRRNSGGFGRGDDNGFGGDGMGDF